MVCILIMQTLKNCRGIFCWSWLHTLTRTFTNLFIQSIKSRVWKEVSTNGKTIQLMWNLYYAKVRQFDPIDSNRSRSGGFQLSKNHIPNNVFKEGIKVKVELIHPINESSKIPIKIKAIKNDALFDNSKWKE